MKEKQVLHNMAGFLFNNYFLLFFILLVMAKVHFSNATEEEAQWIEAYNRLQGTNRPDFQMDNAWLTINSSVHFDITIFSQDTDCYKCPLLETDLAPGKETTTILIPSVRPMVVKLAKVMPGNHLEPFCNMTYHFLERGDYWMFVNYTSYSDGYCKILRINNPPDNNYPILYVFGGLLGVALFWSFIKFIYRNRSQKSACCKKAAVSPNREPAEHSTELAEAANGEEPKDIEKENDLNEEKVQEKDTETAKDIEEIKKEAADVANGDKSVETKKKKRLHSLDTLRGIAIILMVFVNYGGGGYYFFEHAQWNGLTLADLVFPWFIFIMGTAMNFSFRGLLRRKVSRCKILLKVLRRAIILFALGIWLNTAWGPVELNSIRIPGVLQRFSLTYFFVALMETVFARAEDKHKTAPWAAFRDIFLYWPEWLLNFAILAVHLGITFALPVPGCPTGYLGPGGISENGLYFNCTGGAAQYVDRLVLGENHIYQHPTFKEIYKTTRPYDPEGILGIPTSIFLCFLGVQSGRILMTFTGHRERIFRWIIWAVITGAIAVALCKASVNDGVIPINKNLWSTSFILINASFAFILLTLLYIFIDVLGWWSGRPFTYTGMNSIVIYCAHNIFANYFPINWTIEKIHWKLLLLDTWGTAFWVIVAFILYKKKIFVSL